MPRDAYGPGIEVAADRVPRPRRRGTAAGPGFAGRRGRAGRPRPRPPTRPRPPEASRTAAAQPFAGSVRPGEKDLAAQGAATSGPLPYPYELSAASLLAAGLLAALGRRRREQLWRRAFGQRIAAPEGAAAMAESALRIGADEPSVRLLDVGLRQLSQALASQDKALPTVFAAHIGAENLDLWVAPADPNPPAPWTAADGGAVWRLPLAAVTEVALDGANRCGRSPRIPASSRSAPNETGPDPGRPGSRARAGRGARAAPAGPGGPGRARRRAGHQPLVRPDADHPGRLRRGAGHVAPDRLTAVATLDEALPELGGARRRGRAGAGRPPAPIPCSPGGPRPPTRRPGRRTT